MNGTANQASLRDRWLRAAFALVFPFLLFVQVALLVSYLRGTAAESVDFRHLYSSGYMVRTGHGGEIYDFDAMKSFEDRLAGPEPRALPFNHLAYEALLFVPYSLFRFRAAYLLWMGTNFALLLAMFLALRRAGAAWDSVSRVAAAGLFACFLPFGVSLSLGQDSILLTALLAAAAVLLSKGRNFWAGVVLAAGLFKFQFVMPCVILYTAWKNWRLIQGFALGSVCAGALSLAVVGKDAVPGYMHSLFAMSSGLSLANADKYGVHPALMANLRGVCHVLVRPWAGNVVAQVVTAALSLAVLVWAARKGPSFSVAILASVLVSYHCLTHDLSLLILPIVSASQGDRPIALATIVSIGLAFTFGMPMWIAPVPILVFFALNAPQEGPALKEPS